MFRFRIFLDFLAMGLLIACLAYWWLDNISHELIGTAFFALLIVHNVFNRRWYGALPRGRWDAGRIANIVALFCLALSMLVMLVTSLLISRNLFSFMALDGASTMRTIHIFTAYWALLFVGLHLGTRWSVVMNTLRSIFGIVTKNAGRTWLLRILTAAIAWKGIEASFEMGLGSKLMWTYALEMWDFNADTTGFFLNYLSIVALYATVGHYAMKLLQARRQRPVRR